MKKIFSLIAVMLIMATAYDASAQTLYGKWKANMSTVENVVKSNSTLDSFDGSATIEFFEDATAEVTAYVSTSLPFDESVTFHMVLSVETRGTWTMEGNTLTMTSTALHYKVEKVMIEPSNPEFESLLPFIVQNVETQMNATAADALAMQPKSVATIEFVSDNEMIYRDITSGRAINTEDIAIHYYRVEE